MTSLQAELRRVGLTSVGQVRHLRLTFGGDGALEADRLVDGGAELVVVEAPGAGGTPAATAIALLLDLEPVAVIGTAAAPDWAARVLAVRNGLRDVRPHRADLHAMLDTLGDPVLARTTQLLGRLSERRTPALLGSTATVLAAALLARSQALAASSWWLASGPPDDPAGRRALTGLGLPSLLDLELGDEAGRYALALLREALSGG